MGFILYKRLWRIKITPLTPVYRQASLPSPLLTAKRGMRRSMLEVNEDDLIYQIYNES